MDLLKSFPYPVLRNHQGQVLQALEDNWDKYDVFVVNAPTALGKTALARTLMTALRSVSVITPTNLLVEQFREEFPDTPSLSRLDAYWCEEWQRPCPITRSKLLQFCKGDKAAGIEGCKCSSDLATAKYRRGPGIYNYHTYLAHKIYRDVLVVDEAHNLIPVIRERMALTIWQHDYKYSSNMWTVEQMRDWLRTLPDGKRSHKKIQALANAVFSKEPNYMPQRTTETFNGKGTVRGRPEERDCLKLLPVDIAGSPPMFWPGLGKSGAGPSRPSEVSKVVLLSATIGPKDIEALGLEGVGGRDRKVCYIDCKSPIPSTARPIISLATANVNHKSINTAVPLLANEIKGIAEHHQWEKGVVHCTYQLSALLRPLLEGDRYIFHSRLDKKEKYSEFRNSSAPRILVACGMYEGIDLPEDLGRWQVLAKVPWPSLSNPAIQHLARRDPDWYLWECMKTVIQACGRICRTPDDYGVSYILDGTFDRLMEEGAHMVPDWYRDALVVTAAQVLE